MFQKFFTDTLMGRVVKNILSTEYIPLLDFVSNNDIIIQDCLYLYQHFIIKCVETGRLLIDEDIEILYPSDDLYPSVVLYPELGEAIAKFKVVGIYNDIENRRYSYKYISSSNYYDSDTHKHLGQYLRYLNCVKGLNLMPYYNCFNYTILDKLQLVKSDNILSNAPTYELTPNKDYKIYSVPIKFGKKYTIAIDCNLGVICRAVIYGESGMVKCPESKYEYYSDWPDMSSSYRYFNSTSFSNPFVYQVDTTEPLLYQRQKSLYLLIQIPKNNNSSLVVLEGDYSKLDHISADKETTVRKYNQFKHLSLLQFNTHESFAFSDRLIEYLLLNVVNHSEEITGNIEAVQNAIMKLNPKYKVDLANGKYAKGIWDNQIKQEIHKLIDKYADTTYLVDMDGYINKDVETLLHREGIRIDTAR